MADSSRRFFQAWSVDDTPAANVYPTAGGGTLGQRASAMSPATLGSGRVNGNGGNSSTSGNGPSRAVGNGVLGQPLTWWGILFVMLLGLMYFAQKTGADGEFSNIRMSAYNVLTIAFAAIIGIGFFKALFGVFRVPGLSDFVEAV